ncbi:MAG: peptidoglycan-binding protein [Treponema sp.]|jgi:hypothetical protein|nr:peptidoglycan-binding protein [Treponema sp.]
MRCGDVLDTVYGAEDVFPLRKRLGMAFHIILCGHCAVRLNVYKETRSLLRTGFFPPSPDFSNAIMNSICHETFDTRTGDPVFETSGFSTRGWVIAGIAMLLSLVTAFFGQDFAMFQDASFLLPLGIITGMAITSYGALFIGSHLKELSERFKL